MNRKLNFQIKFTSFDVKKTDLDALKTQLSTFIALLCFMTNARTSKVLDFINVTSKKEFYEKFNLGKIYFLD